MPSTHVRVPKLSDGLEESSIFFHAGRGTSRNIVGAARSGLAAHVTIGLGSSAPGGAHPAQPYQLTTYFVADKAT
jgi:hypothetical protein